MAPALHSPGRGARQRHKPTQVPLRHADNTYDRDALLNLLRTATPHSLRHQNCFITAHGLRATKISIEVNHVHREHWQWRALGHPKSRAEPTKRPGKISANPKRVSATRARPANRQPDASPAGFRHALAKPASRAILHHGIHGKQFESHRAGLQGAIARSAERQYLRRATRLRHDPAGFSAAATAARNRPGPSPSSPRRRPAKQSNLPSSKLSLGGATIQQSLQRPNRLRHSPTRPATI